MITEERICAIHGLVKFYKRTKYTWSCSKCMTAAVTKHRQKLKLKAIEYKGGKCESCEYKKSVWALQFHHTDPGKKDFTVGQSFTTKWERIQPELDKCILLCSNCHAELHERLEKNNKS